MPKLTPMMQQYMDIKNKYRDSVLFFRLGDFYEMFFDDAILASRELEITLTGRECGQEERAPMCGVPYHSADSYIAKLVEKGYKVAICEQVEDAAEAKGIVKRDVIRVITPGTITDSKVLNEKTNNYLVSIYMDNEGLGIAYVDISIGDLYTTEIKGEDNYTRQVLIDELAKVKPSEIIVNEFIKNDDILIKTIKDGFNTVVNYYHDWAFDFDFSSEVIKTHQSIISLDGIGLKNKIFAIASTGALLQYLKETQKMSLSHINNINNYNIDNYMVLDINTRNNLELLETLRDKEKKGSLLWVLDKTSTAMGGRLLRKWIQEPLLNLEEINDRLDFIEFLIDDIAIMDDIKDLLKNVYDIERIMGKISYGNCTPRDLLSLKMSVGTLPNLKNLLINSQNNNLINLVERLDTLDDIFSLIDNSILEDAPLSLKEGGIIKASYDSNLLELREASLKGKEWLSKLQESERERTGIKTLKVGYNKVFGYYLECTKSYINLVPDDYIRKQTLSNSERYITTELKEMEAKILGSDEKMMNLEYQLFVEIREKIKIEVKRIQNTCKIISTIDVLNSLAQVGFKSNYVKPKINQKGFIDIQGGRHPVVEKMMNNNQFVPNDTYLDNNNNRLSIITGPNMAGKSTYMRQIALITLMAQIGSFVPAESAEIGIVDKIFTRVGASDNLTQGQSTFMVEMSELANILNNSTKNSLVILDEIGRGTSTYDGLSIAWSVVEYIANKNKIGAKTLFATHYHELTELEGKINGVKNFKVCVEEDGEDIVFLRKIIRGGADKSYGIEVARLAGVPNEVIDRAKIILSDLESRDINNEDFNQVKESKQNYQIDLFSSKALSLIDEIKDIEIINITPLGAMNMLYDLINKAKNT